MIIVEPRRRSSSSAAWRVVVAVLALVAFVVSAERVSAQAADPLSVVQHFIDARNAGDVAGAMALVADDMRFVGGPICTPAKPCVGRAAAQRDVVEQFIQTYHAHLTIVGTPQVLGSQVKARTEVSDDRSKATGVDRLVANLTVEVRDGKMASWVSILDPSDPQTAKFLAFQQAHAARAPSVLPATGEGGPLASLPVAVLVAGILLTLGLAVRRSIRLS